MLKKIISKIYHYMHNDNDELTALRDLYHNKIYKNCKVIKKGDNYTIYKIVINADTLPPTSDSWDMVYYLSHECKENLYYFFSKILKIDLTKDISKEKRITIKANCSSIFKNEAKKTYEITYFTPDDVELYYKNLNMSYIDLIRYISQLILKNGSVFNYFTIHHFDIIFKDIDTLLDNKK